MTREWRGGEDRPIGRGLARRRRRLQGENAPRGARGTRAAPIRIRAAIT